MDQKSFIVEMTPVRKREAIGIRGGAKRVRRTVRWERNFPSGQKFAP
jgi:hypothetical protein